MKLPKIVGVAGTNGSGKDIFGILLHEICGYKNVSLSDILRAELDQQGLEHSRANLSRQSRIFREAEGDGALAVRTLSASNPNDKLAITSIRAPGEAQVIKQAGGILVWIDADQKLRYERVFGGERQRVTDMVSFEDFQISDHNEMYPSAAGNDLNMAGVKEICDVFIDNNFSSVDEYKAYLESFFELKTSN